MDSGEQKTDIENRREKTDKKSKKSAFRLQDLLSVFGHLPSKYYSLSTINN